jgi:dihydroorotate dehydrogenase (fumarate)
VLPSLFEEQITLARTGRIRHVDPLDDASASRLNGFQTADDYAFSPDEYAEHVARAKRAVRMPVVGSLNGTSNESWLTFSRLIEQAGADALVLFNRFYQPDIDVETMNAMPQAQLSRPGVV